MINHRIFHRWQTIGLYPATSYYYYSTGLVLYRGPENRAEYCISNNCFRTLIWPRQVYKSNLNVRQHRQKNDSLRFSPGFFDDGATFSKLVIPRILIIIIDRT